MPTPAGLIRSAWIARMRSEASAAAGHRPPLRECITDSDGDVVSDVTVWRDPEPVPMEPMGPCGILGRGRVVEWMTSTALVRETSVTVWRVADLSPVELSEVVRRLGVSWEWGSVTQRGACLVIARA